MHSYCKRFGAPRRPSIITLNSTWGFGGTLAWMPKDAGVWELGSMKGDTVGHLVRSVFSDVDRATPSGEDYKVGIAVVDVDRRFGDWLWRCDSTKRYRRFIGGILENGAVYPASPTSEKATLLAEYCSIKFLPNENFNTKRDTSGAFRPASDEPYITFLGWDRVESTYRFVDGINKNNTWDEKFYYTETKSSMK